MNPGLLNYFHCFRTVVSDIHSKFIGPLKKCLTGCQNYIVAFTTFRFSNQQDKSWTFPKIEGPLTVLHKLFSYSGQSLSKCNESSLNNCNKLKMKNIVGIFFLIALLPCIYCPFTENCRITSFSELQNTSLILCLYSSGLCYVTWHKHLMTHILLVMKNYFQKESYCENPSNDMSNARHSDTVPLRLFSLLLAFPTGF